MTKSELQTQLAHMQEAYDSLCCQVDELRNIIIEGNRKTNIPHNTNKSVDIYEFYNELLQNKVEEITGEKIDFCYYTFD